MSTKYFQGGAKFPTGSKVCELLNGSRIGEIPIPTVKVRMRENVEKAARVFPSVQRSSITP